MHARFPGGVDFDKGLIQTDFMLWPLFQAVDVDMILTCLEVALSTQGRVIMTSTYPTMLCLCVNILKYMVELRGWHGICLLMIHSVCQLYDALETVPAHRRQLTDSATSLSLSRIPDHTLL